MDLTRGKMQNPATARLLASFRPKCRLDRGK